MKKIASLSQSQIDEMPRYVDKWLRIGLSTEPVDFEKAKTAVAKAYKCAGLPAPKSYYHFSSPLSAAYGA